MAIDTQSTRARHKIDRVRLMQKIMLRAKPGCGRTECFESGPSSWELVVGEWERSW